jgi:hypothetical protein
VFHDSQTIATLTGVVMARQAARKFSPRKTDMNITSKDVSDWMREQLKKTHELNEYGNVEISIRGFRNYDPTGPCFSIYCNPALRIGEQPNIEQCFAALSGKTTKQQADELREQAAKLLTQANEIESNAQKEPTT